MAIYAGVAALWIMFSDMVAAAVARSAGHFALVEMLKGLVFVATTSLLLYALIRRDTSALRQSEARHRTTLENMADALFLVDREGRLVEVNQATLGLLGLEPGRKYAHLREWIGLLDIRHPDGRSVQWSELPSARALMAEPELALHS